MRFRVFGRLLIIVSLTSNKGVMLFTGGTEDELEQDACRRFAEWPFKSNIVFGPPWFHANGRG